MSSNDDGVALFVPTNLRYREQRRFGNLRQARLHQKDKWIQYALLSAHASQIGKMYDTTRHVSQDISNDDADKFLPWIVILVVIITFFVVSRYLPSIREPLWGFSVQVSIRRDRDREGARGRISQVNILERIETLSPAKPYSVILQDLHGSNHDGVEMANFSNSDNLEKPSLNDSIEVGCSICFEEFADDTVVRILPCRHIFHKHCLDTWFNRSSLCPLCMHDYATSALPPLIESGNTNVESSTEPPAGIFSRFRQFLQRNFVVEVNRYGYFSRPANN